MFFRLFLLFTLVPIIELWLLVWVTRYTSFPFTFALVISTGVLGAYLARRQGWQTWRKIQDELAQGHLPTTSLFDAALILVAGALLVTPGILTDLVGFSLLVPPTRRMLQRWIRDHLRPEVTFHSGPSAWDGSRDSDDPGVIDVESHEPDSPGRESSEGDSSERGR